MQGSVVVRRELAKPPAVARFAALLVVALLAIGCVQPAQQTTDPAPASSLAEPSTSTPPIAVGTTSPCAEPLRAVANASQLMADKLATLREPLTAKSYDGWVILGAARSANATLTLYAQTITALRTCPEAAAVVEGMEALGREASSHIAIVLAAGQAVLPGPRAAMVALFELLPDVVKVSEEAKKVADSLSVEVAVATLPEGASEPLGELAPIPTRAPENIRTIAANFFGTGVTVKTFTVGGQTPGAIIRSMNEKGPYSEWVGGRASATTEARPDYRFTLGSTTSGACRLVSTGNPVVVIRYVVTLPKWSAPAGVSRSTIDYWNDLIVEIATHERHHVEIYRETADDLNAAYRSSTCDNYLANFKEVLADTALEQCKFDMQEYGYALGLSLEDCVAR